VGDKVTYSMFGFDNSNVEWVINKTPATTPATPPVITVTHTIDASVEDKHPQHLTELTHYKDTFTHSWDVAGEYTLQIAESNGFCTPVTKTLTVYVHALPSPTIDGFKEVCAEDPETSLDPDPINTVTYSTQVGMTNYNWNVTGGTIVETVPFSNIITVVWGSGDSGTVSVNYTNTSGCSATSATSETITIYARPSPSGISTDE